MASRKTTADKLSAEIAKVLDEYGDDVRSEIDEVTVKIGKAGVKALKNASSIFGGTRYKKSWTSKAKSSRYETAVTLYSKVPGLPHLLEHGHAKRSGGRVPGRVHIAPVEEQLVDEYTKAVEGAVSK